jgi:hypothetical protein
MHGKSGVKGGAVNAKAFYWEKEGEKVEGEHPASLFVTFFLVTIGSYSYIVAPLCHYL